MMLPLHRPPHWIPLSIEEHPHSSRAGKARDQELILPRYHHHVGIWVKVKRVRINLTDREDFRKRGIGQVDERV